VELDVSHAVLLRAGEGEVISDRAERTVRLLLAHELLDVTWSRYEAGEEGPGPHVHREHVDSFFVLSGELVFGLGAGAAQRVVAGPGTWISAPQNVVHTFRNESDGAATFLNYHAPSGGFATYMRAARDGGRVDWDNFDPPEDGGRDAAAAVVSGPGDGERFDRERHSLAIKVALEEVSAIEFEFGSGWGGIAAHHHDDHADSFFLLDGAGAFLRDGTERVHVEAGSFVAAPPGVVHGFAPVASGRMRALNVHAPDGGFAGRIRG
jgi:mannose-6-phosphate isomerase-like protein (cupin superfamily)